MENTGIWYTPNLRQTRLKIDKNLKVNTCFTLIFTLLTFFYMFYPDFYLIHGCQCFFTTYMLSFPLLGSLLSGHGSYRLLRSVMFISSLGLFAMLAMSTKLNLNRRIKSLSLKYGVALIAEWVFTLSLLFIGLINKDLETLPGMASTADQYEYVILSLIMGIVLAVQTAHFIYIRLKYRKKI